MVKKNYHKLFEAYKKAGGFPDAFINKRFAHLMIHKNKVYSSHQIEGLKIQSKETENGVDVSFKMKKGYFFDSPVHFCFGMIPKEGVQEINIFGIIEDNAKLELLAYCVFPNAINIKHKMVGNIKIGESSTFKYTEIHHHGNKGGISVLPKLNVIIGKNSSYENNFYLLKGKAGRIKIDYNICAKRNSKAEMLAKILASGSDEVFIKEKLLLEDKFSRGNINSRVVGRDNSKTEIINEIVALKANCIGHVNCIETILDNATAKAYPLIDVRHKDARVTHEAAIGSLNHKQLEVLMSKGLNEEQATEILVKSLLR